MYRRLRLSLHTNDVRGGGLVSSARPAAFYQHRRDFGLVPWFQLPRDSVIE
jgi:hypothetical protein